ncbi:MAG: PQQ-dependent sugar dehydrogenase [Acidobacteriia bacterium]|nr:PQQ-dependent sugar dehydrogenase [Terriglobia bacterium]
MTNAKGIVGQPVRLCCGIVLLALLLLSLPVAWAQYPLQYPTSSQVTKDGTAILIEDYANPPLSSAMGGGTYPPPINFQGMLARVNALRSEPANTPLAASRFFVNDLNGILYTLDKTTRKFTPYITFAEVFPHYTTNPGFGAGVVSIAFDPNYAKNGKFYTVHTEDPARDGSPIPSNAHLPGLKVDGYTTTPSVNPPAGTFKNESVLVEWTDTNIKNSTFEGTARELLRVGFYSAIHQMGDVLFDPLAKPGQSDYDNLYISVGDGGAGETPGAPHATPQRLDALNGKILRITPDINLRPKDILSPNGRYRIPSTGSDPNPFVGVSSARGEIFAYGLRNPHRITWDPVTNTLIANDVGLHSWEEIDIITKGANYGYAEREGNEVVIVNEEGKTASQQNPPVPFPDTDLITVVGLDKPVAPVYPAAVYSHEEGDTIGSGFVYRGKLMPQMVGKYIFSDMTTGRLFYTVLAEMIATHGERGKQAPIHEIQIMYKSPYDNSIQAPVKRRMYDIVAEAYAHKDGVPNPDSHDGVLPGWAATVGGWRNKVFTPGPPDPYGVPYGGGRADVRLSMGGDGEIYVMSKSDGMIRRLAAVVTPPPPTSTQTAAH